MHARNIRKAVYYDLDVNFKLEIRTRSQKNIDISHLFRVHV